MNWLVSKKHAYIYENLYKKTHMQEYIYTYNWNLIQTLQKVNFFETNLFIWI